MKKILFLFAFALCTVTSYGQESLNSQPDPEVTTYYFIRHAEKQRQNADDKDPSLTYQGYQRADNWAKIFQFVSFDAVYSTDYTRTKETAKPTADSKNLPILVYDPSNMYTESFQFNTKGKKVLIVGHSNTTPSFVNKVLGKNKYKNMDDKDNGSLFIVTLIDGKPSDVVLKIN